MVSPANGNGHAHHETIPERPVMNQAQLQEILLNELHTRRTLLNRMLEEHHDIDKECGYPKEITASDYRFYFDREGIAERVVKVWPRESWRVDPWIYETEDAQETAWEKAWKALDDRLGVMAYFQRLDELSGIGHFGVMLLGVSDGLALHEPIEGVEEALVGRRPEPLAAAEEDTGQGPVIEVPVEAAEGEERKSSRGKKRSLELLFLRVFDESLVTISEYDGDMQSPRYGQPKFYNISMQDPTVALTSGSTPPMVQGRVHWTRVIHVADNRMSSEIFGVPRMRPVFNRLVDLRRLYGGGAEMFWKGAFPGYVFEANPDLVDATIDTDDTKAQVARYTMGLQRYFAMTGVTVKSLSPQVADPTAHVNGQIQAISIALDIPQRILMGSERGELASSQDARAWNDRVMRRQRKHLTPHMIRPFVDRLMAIGILPRIERYEVEWPDLNTYTDIEKAELAGKVTEALSKYVAGGLEQLLPPLTYFVDVLGREPDQAEEWLKAALEQVEAGEQAAQDEQKEEIADALGAGEVVATRQAQTTSDAAGAETPAEGEEPDSGTEEEEEETPKPPTAEEILAAGPTANFRRTTALAQQKWGEAMAARRQQTADRRAANRARLGGRDPQGIKRDTGGKFAKTEGASAGASPPGTAKPAAGAPRGVVASAADIRELLGTAQEYLAQAEKAKHPRRRALLEKRAAKIMLEGYRAMERAGMPSSERGKVIRALFNEQQRKLMEDVTANATPPLDFEQLRDSIQDSLILHQAMDPDVAVAVANKFASDLQRKWFFATRGQGTKHSPGAKAAGGEQGRGPGGKFAAGATTQTKEGGGKQTIGKSDAKLANFPTPPAPGSLDEKLANAPPKAQEIAGMIDRGDVKSAREAMKSQGFDDDEADAIIKRRNEKRKAEAKQQGAQEAEQKAAEEQAKPKPAAQGSASIDEIGQMVDRGEYSKALQALKEAGIPDDVAQEAMARRILSGVEKPGKTPQLPPGKPPGENPGDRPEHPGGAKEGQQGQGGRPKPPPLPGKKGDSDEAAWAKGEAVRTFGPDGKPTYWKPGSKQMADQEAAWARGELVKTTDAQGRTSYWRPPGPEAGPKQKQAANLAAVQVLSAHDIGDQVLPVAQMLGGAPVRGVKALERPAGAKPGDPTVRVPLSALNKLPKFKGKDPEAEQRAVKAGRFQIPFLAVDKNGRLGLSGGALLKQIRQAGAKARGRRETAKREAAQAVKNLPVVISKKAAAAFLQYARPFMAEMEKAAAAQPKQATGARPVAPGVVRPVSPGPAPTGNRRVVDVPGPATPLNAHARDILLAAGAPPERAEAILRGLDTERALRVARRYAVRHA